MARPPISDEKYQALADAFAEDPGNYAAAGRAAGVSERTAKKAWNVGYPRLGRPPLKTHAEEVQVMARAARAKAHAAKASEAESELVDAYTARVQQQEADRLRAAEDAARTRKQEGDMVSAARGNVIALLAKSGRLMKAALEESTRLEDAFRTGIDPATKKQLTVAQRLKFVRESSRIIAEATKSAREVIEMERLLMGLPTEIIGLSADTMDPEQQKHILRLGAKALARMEGDLPGQEVRNQLDPDPEDDRDVPDYLDVSSDTMRRAGEGAPGPAE